MWTNQEYSTIYGAASTRRLDSCHLDIQRIFKALAIDGWDIAILCGHRTAELQLEAYTSGKSKVK